MSKSSPALAAAISEVWDLSTHKAINSLRKQTSTTAFRDCYNLYNYLIIRVRKSEREREQHPLAVSLWGSNSVHGSSIWSELAKTCCRSYTWCCRYLEIYLMSEVWFASAASTANITTRPAEKLTHWWRCFALLILIGSAHHPGVRSSLAKHNSEVFLVDQHSSRPVVSNYRWLMINIV